MPNPLHVASFLLGLALAGPSLAQDKPGPGAEQPIRVLLVLGGCCHDYAAQRKILAEGIAARANVKVTVAYDPDNGTKHLNPVYEKADWSKGFDVVIHDECSADVKDLGVIENTILKPHTEGLPAVVLHCGMHCYRSKGWPDVVTPWFEFTGLQTTGHGAQQPIAITYVDKESPITQGLEDWTTVNEELYNNIAGKVLDTAHPLARGKQGKDETVVTWTNLYKGKAKVFATTIGHNNQTVGDARYLDLVTRGLLWSVGKLDEKHFKAVPRAAGADAAAKEKSPFAADAKGLAPVDLARAREATASSFQADGGGHPAGAAVDGDPATRWCADGGRAPQWLRVDLGRPQDVVGCRITWEHPAGYRYRVEGSTDGKDWKTLAEEVASDAAEQVREHAFVACCGAAAPGDGLRYVRLNVTGLPEGSWASVYELEVFGKEKVKPTAAAAAAASPSRRKALAGLKAPEGFDLAIFAAPPDVNYPTCLAAAPTGAVFVGVDEMGSLGRKPGRGRVVRCVDTDGDGAADTFNDFAKMDHPRGLAWDGAAGTLYVLHPPFLTACHDDNGDGVSDRSEVLVKGIANEEVQAERGADHTTNGIRIGIDGWIYVAMGDFGCTDAVGKDGTHLQKHGGGIVRVRTDGSGLEEYTRGQRNIYDVAIDPLMNAFTRDNTNDGDGWDVRLSYVVPGGNYGYPSLFKNFPEEIVKPMLDLGGGSPCGSLYVDEPGMPGDSGKMLYTVEWGRNAVMRHPLSPVGAGFDAKEQKWMDLPRGTDMDVDGQGRLFITSWANGGFDYSGPDVGYVVRLVPKGNAPGPFPDMKKASAAQLVEYLASDSAVRRLAAQREMLHRGGNDFADELEELAMSASRPLEARAAAVFTLAQLPLPRADATLAHLLAQDSLREFALRAIADRGARSTSAALPRVAEALKDPNPRVRLAAAWALGRFGTAESGAALVPLLADADPLVSHVAVSSLVKLRAADECLRAMSDSTPGLAGGAARVLQSLHEDRVVDGLIDRSAQVRNPSVRASLYRALCRLVYDEGQWKGDWWGTRPDTSGPYYDAVEWQATGKIKQFLSRAMAHEDSETLRGLVLELKRNKIDLPEAGPVIVKIAAGDPTFRQVLVDLLGGKKALAEGDVAFLRDVAISDLNAPGLRARAIRLLAQANGDTSALGAAVDALALVAADERPAPELEAALQEFARDNRYGQQVHYFAKLTESESAPRREIAYAVLLNLAGAPDRDRGQAKSREAAREAIDRGWKAPVGAASLLRAIARTKTDRYNAVVEARRSDVNVDVARAADFAAARLGLNGAVAAVPGGATVEGMGPEKVVALVSREKGDAKRGAELFARQGCVACHTVSAEESPKGPYLGGISARYNRAELCESILKPSAKIAQGFETQWFKPKSGDVVEGFVTRESGDEVEFRNAAGVTTVLRKPEINRRGKRELSVMPEGLVGNLTPQDFASLLAYLESLNGK